MAGETLAELLFENARVAEGYEVRAMLYKGPMLLCVLTLCGTVGVG